jgi:hypothetical protein
MVVPGATIVFLELDHQIGFLCATDEAERHQTALKRYLLEPVAYEPRNEFHAVSGN